MIKDPEKWLYKLKTHAKNVKCELLSTEWKGSHAVYNIKCLVCNNKSLVSYVSFVNKCRGCPKCGRRRSANSLRLSVQDVVLELRNMGCSVPDDIRYEACNLPLKGLGITFNGIEITGTLGAIRKSFKEKGFPVSPRRCSIPDLLIGFICSFVDSRSKFLTYPDFLKRQQADVLIPSDDSFTKDIIIEFQGTYYHSSSKRKSDDLRKKQLCSESDKILIEILETEWPIDLMSKAICVLDRIKIYLPDKCKKALELVSTLINEDKFHLNLYEWCDRNYIFNSAKEYQEQVRNNLLTNGIPIRNSKERGRLRNVIEPKKRYYSEEIRELAINLGYAPMHSNQLSINASKSHGGKPFKDDTGTVYNTLNEAAHILNIDKRYICMVLKKKVPHAKGRSFKYLSDD